MLLLLVFAFLAGLITILSPCILPVLPIVLAGSATGGHQRPLGIITGFVVSFTLFTLFAFAIISFLGLSPDTLRYAAIAIIGLFGFSLIIPQASDFLKKAFSGLANLQGTATKPGRPGYWGGVVVGLSLGLIWTPCVGPIISSVITLAATSSVTWQAAALTLAYTVGTAIPMFAIMMGGRALLQRIPWLLNNTEKLQKAFGVIMILIALAMTFGLDRKFQTFILDTFPSYGSGLTKLEDNDGVKKSLEDLNGIPSGDSNTSPTPTMGSLLDLTQYPSAPNPKFTGATKWLNSEPLTLEKLKGKVVLVDFWTYTCINCIRTLPYLTSWDAKYKDQGLVIIGIHAPEFAFEKEEANVRTAMKEYDITYPVVQDNDFNIWKSYKNRYWPAKYLIDAQGRVRDTHFGEGAYEETERKIQELLKEAGMQGVEKEVTKEETAERKGSTTPETYLGLARMERYFGDVQPSKDVREFLTPEEKSNNSIDWLTPTNHFSLLGKWRFDQERAMPEAYSHLQFRVKANDVYLVMRPKEAGKVAHVEMALGAAKAKELPKEWYGKDVGKGGIVTIDGDRLYHLIHLPDAASVEKVFPGSVDGSYMIDLTFGPLPGDTLPELYAFTFG